MRRIYAGVTVFVCLACAAAQSAGERKDNQGKLEKPYALIFGTVWGPDSRPVYGVKVKMRRASEKKARWEMYSDHHGEFAQRVPAGKADYVLWVDFKGVKVVDGRELRPGEEASVHIEFDERVDTSLHLK
jgi:hypothetical protein